jgi:hypothetical protein
MIKDLKNVIITFGLIALVLTQGSLFYQKKVRAEYILATQQSKLQNIKKSKLVKIAQDKTLKQQNTQAQLLAQQQAQANAQAQAQMTMRPSRQSRAS